MKNLFKKIIIFILILIPLNVYAIDEKIKVELKTTDEVLIDKPIIDSSVEVEFKNLFETFQNNVILEIEKEILKNSDDVISKKSKIYIKDKENIKVETKLSTGFEVSIVKTKSDFWIYFPKTNMIMELKENSNLYNNNLNFLTLFFQEKDNYVINKNQDEQKLFYEIYKKDNELKKVVYEFSKEKKLSKIKVIENNEIISEISVNSIINQPIEEEIFIKPKNAIKMPINEMPNF